MAERSGCRSSENHGSDGSPSPPSASPPSSPAASEAGRAVPLGIPVAVNSLQQRVALEFRFHIGGKVEMGELEQLDRLQQLRRHHQGLPLAHLQALHQRH